MNGFTLLIGSAVIFLIAYVVYGSWLAKQWGIDPKRKTPAETQKDGIDYLPTKPAVLLGHHFSSIAGAGPIVGPITAAVFGWVPVTLWIIVGSVFFGGVHDYGSLVASLRHKGKSIGQIIEANIGERAKILFAIFAWITLLVVIAAFANIVAATFHSACCRFRPARLPYRHISFPRYSPGPHRHGCRFLHRSYLPDRPF